MTKPNPPWKPIATAPDDGTTVLGFWEEFPDEVHAVEQIGGSWYGISARYTPPDFWRERPPGPFGPPENAKLLEACRIGLRYMHLDPRNGPPGQIVSIAIANAEGTDA